MLHPSGHSSLISTDLNCEPFRLGKTQSERVRRKTLEALPMSEHVLLHFSQKNTFLDVRPVEDHERVCSSSVLKIFGCVHQKNLNLYTLVRYQDQESRKETADTESARCMKLLHVPRHGDHMRPGPGFPLRTFPRFHGRSRGALVTGGLRN